MKAGLYSLGILWIAIGWFLVGFGWGIKYAEKQQERAATNAVVGVMR